MADDGFVRWRRMLGEATERLERAGIESPAVDARRIVEEASGAEGIELAGVLDQPATERGVARFDRMLARREAGEPLQYVLGRWAFRTLDLFVDRRVLIPRPETEVVAGVAIDEVRRRAEAGASPIAVDLGTGSGAIGLAIAAECVAARVVATEVSAEALVVARSNLAGLGTAATRVELFEGSWFAALPNELRGRVDVLVSNPPYVATDDDLPAVVADWEPVGALIGGPTGLEPAAEIVAGAGEWLAPSGVLILELAPQQMELAAELLVAADLRPDVVDDLAGRARVLVGRR